MVIPVAALAFAAKEWFWPALAAGLVSAALVWWSYRRSPLPRLYRIWGAGLKVLGITALLLCLLEPVWTGERAKPGANLFAVIADNSQSMALRGEADGRSRGEQIRAYLTGEQSGWRAPLAQGFEVRNYLADSRLQPSTDFTDLTFQGRSSELVRSLRLLAERSKGQPLAGALLFTDGTAGDLAAVGEDLAALPPIYPVIAGANAPRRDLAVTETSVSQTAFEDAPVTVVATVTARGFIGEEVRGRLLAVSSDAPANTEPTIVSESTLTPTQADERLIFRMQLRPIETGVLIYRFEASTVIPDSGEEATLANNASFVHVDRGAGIRRILYVGGRPSWEYKFLQRALQGDDQMQLVGLVRIARREAKFEFRGRAGESSNPLFRGFGNQSAEEVERYDQPVLIRLNIDPDNPAELAGNFPKTAEELFRYHAVILDDLEAEFFTAEQMSLLQRFVSERGAGFLMLGGTESFGEGNFARTPVGDMLPVYLDRRAPLPTLAPGEKLRLALTREGWLEPWARLRDNEAGERARLTELPGVDVLNPAGGVKPAASVVATVTDGAKESPALVTQRFGRGRTAALLIGDLWQSGLGDEALSKDLGRAWRQMIRWLVADVPALVEARVEPDAVSGGMRIEVRIRDAKFQPIDNVNLKIDVERGTGGAPIELAAEPSSSEPGLYETTFLPRESDGYRVKATARNGEGVLLGQASAGWSTDFARAEFGDLEPNRAALERLAAATGGRVIAPEELESFVRDLPSQRMPVTETWSYPIWHTPVLFLFALGCLVGEWGLRRAKGLA